MIGVASIVAANSWLNTPQGFALGADGLPKDVDVASALFTPAFPYEFAHMIIAAYLGAGFLVASVYAVGMLRGRNDRYHRLGFLIPFTDRGDPHAGADARRRPDHADGDPRAAGEVRGDRG